jgi:hypothetical protein
MNGWQTTVAGIVAVLAAVALLIIHPSSENTALGVGLISAGVGLWRAPDPPKGDHKP